MLQFFIIAVQQIICLLFDRIARFLSTTIFRAQNKRATSFFLFILSLFLSHPLAVSRFFFVMHMSSVLLSFFSYITLHMIFFLFIHCGQCNNHGNVDKRDNRHLFIFVSHMSCIANITSNYIQRCWLFEIFEINFGQFNI